MGVKPWSFGAFFAMPAGWHGHFSASGVALRQGWFGIVSVLGSNNSLVPGVFARDNEAL